ncbi:hypothetical protein Bca52824_004163 [Brassica carinata]|uniref:Uncharacterized protein n=1 Tax=Brassica carinata TaxID=52824 RepID=A0A8X7WRG9_BRACI|nr:hypothetical protein Bca52824_004163 [Brassica carinata]
MFLEFFVHRYLSRTTAVPRFAQCEARKHKEELQRCHRARCITEVKRGKKTWTVAEEFMCAFKEEIKLTEAGENSKAIEGSVDGSRISARFTDAPVSIRFTDQTKLNELAEDNMSLHSSLPKRSGTTFRASVFDGFAMQLNAKKIWQCTDTLCFGQGFEESVTTSERNAYILNSPPQPAMMKTRFGCKVSQANVIFHYPVLTGPNATFITLTDNKWSMIFITVPG